MNLRFADLPCGGWISLQMTHFRCRCRVEAGSRHGDRVTQMADCGGAVVVYPDQSGRSHCLVDPNCVPAAAHPSSSSPWPLAGSCRRIRLVHPWLRLQSDGPSPDPSDHRDFGYASQGGRRWPLHLLSDDHQESSHDVGGHGRCGRCCSSHHLNYRHRKRKI